MEVTDKNREAFGEKMAQLMLKTHPPVGQYEFGSDRLRRYIDCAHETARDHFAPKLSQTEAADLIAATLGKWLPAAKEGANKVKAKEAIAALRAAGMRFKDEP